MAINTNLHRFSMEVMAMPFPTASAKTLPVGLSTMFSHDWSQSLVMETAYRTSIVESNDNCSEERRGLLDRPTRGITVTWAGLDKAGLGLLLADIRKITNLQWVVPIYQDIVYLTQAYTDGPLNKTIYCSPAQRRVFPGGRIAIVTFDRDYKPTNVAYRIVSQRFADRLVIDSQVGFNLTTANAVIMPCMDVEYVLDPEITYYTDQTATVTLDFEEIVGPSSLPPLWTGLPSGFNTYDSLPIFDPDHDWSATRKVGYIRPGMQTAQGRGTLTSLRGDHAKLQTEWNLAGSRAEMWKILQFFDSRRGRLIPFWGIDPETIWTPVSVATGYIDITALGDYDDFQADFDYVGLRMKDGTKIVRPVSNFLDFTSYWRVLVSENFPTLALADIDGVARARKTRFSKDYLKEDWQHDNWVRIQVETLELLAEGEVTP